MAYQRKTPPVTGSLEHPIDIARKELEQLQTELHKERESNERLLAENNRLYIEVDSLRTSSGLFFVAATIFLVAAILGLRK